MMSMPQEHRGSERGVEHRFESEPSDEWQTAYGRGGPVRSDEPERDYFFEQNAAPYSHRARESVGESRRAEQMNWRTVGAQDYPGQMLDDTLAGSHRGKGPKGYRPTDERLREKVCELLTDDPFVDATDITVSVANGEITLSGSVETRSMKYAVEDLVADIPGVSAVHNSIQVRRTF
jgi:osmotically-inducible protein OsmY